MTVPTWVEALLVASALTAAVGVTGAVTWSGALAGAALSFCFAWKGGWPVVAAFAALVVLGTVSTRLGFSRKLSLGVAQSGGGRRGARHALANAGPAALLLLVDGGMAGRVAATAALLAALTDTLSSEIGMLSPERPRLLLLGRPARVGEDGAMSWSGTAAGVLAAVLLGFGASHALEVPGAFGALAAGAFSGTLADSLLGATVESRLPRSIANEAVNAAASLAGGLVASGGFVPA